MRKLFFASVFMFLVGHFPAIATPLQFAIVGVEEGTVGFDVTQGLATEVGRRSGVEIEIVALPAKRAFRLLKKGLIDGDWSRVDGYGTEIPRLIKIPEPIASHPYLAYTANEEIVISGWESLKPYRVAYLRGWKVVELNLQPFHNNLFPVSNNESGFRFIAAGRADVFINIPFIAKSHLKKDSLRGLGIKGLHPPLDYLHVFAYVLPKHADLTKRMNASLKAMKEDGTYDRIMSANN